MDYWRGPLSQKVAILTGVPLGFAIIFLAILLALTTKSEHDTQSALKASQVLETSQSISADVVDTLARIAKPGSEVDEAEGLDRACKQGIENITHDTQLLSELLETEQTPGPLIQQLKQRSQEICDQINKVNLALKSDNTKSTRVALAMEAHEQLSRFQTTLKLLVKPYLTLSEKFQRAEEVANRNILLVLLVGVVANVLICCWLAVLAGRTMFKDIELMMTNLRRFENGEHPDDTGFLSNELREINSAIADASKKLAELEADLRSSEEQCQAVLRSSPDGLVVLDSASRIKLANESTERLLCLCAGELAGRSISELLPGVEVFDMPPGKSIEMIARRASGEPVPVDVARGVGAEGACVVLMMRDVSARQVARQLKEISAAMLKNELAEPLQFVLRSCAEVDAGGKSLTDAGHQRLRANSAGCHRLLSLIDQLNDFPSTINALVVDKSHESVALILECAIQELQPLAQQLGIKLVCSCETLIANCDRAALARVVLNLVSNAIKFSPPDTEVVIQAHSDVSDLVISVRDSGRGIPIEKIPQLFETFTQVRPEDSAHGAGLGLAICKKIVDEHGGRIDVESSVDLGTTFRIVIPDAVIRTGSHS